MDLSIIIAHYDPGNLPDCLNSFHKTLAEISAQKVDYEVEIIIADDGSVTHQDIQSLGSPITDQDERTIYQLEGNALATWKRENDFNYSSISHWLYLPKIEPMMSKARISNIAIAKTSSENLFFLDDDNYFISKNSIEAVINLLKKYHLVFGQIQDKSGRLRPYSSRRVQGTTFGVKKETITEAGLFGEWTETVSCGVDSDIWWKLYQYFQNYPHFKACYTPQIQTRDSCSKRWRSHIKQFFRHRAVKKLFNQIYGCTNYRNVNMNPSRNKSNWMDNLT